MRSHIQPKCGPGLEHSSLRTACWLLGRWGLASWGPWHAMLSTLSSQVCKWLAQPLSGASLIWASPSMPGSGSLLSPIRWLPCSHAQNRKPAPRSTQTRQGRAGRDQTNTPCEQEVTPCSGGIPSPLAHLPGASHIPAGLACLSVGPCPQAACPVWSHSSLSTGAADSTSFPRILQSTPSTLHPAGTARPP